MPLILTMTQTRGAQTGGGDRQIRTLAQGTLSIGRAPGNDWVLADPDQHLSRTHCMVAFEGGRYVLTDLSTNGLLINGAREPTTRNSRTVLTDGDTVQLGTYMLAVAEADGPAAGAGASPFGASNFIAPRADPFAAGDGRGAIGGAAGGDNPLDIDPLDDPLGNPLAPQPDRGGSFHHPLPHMPPAMRGEDPFDVADGERRRPATLDDDLFRTENPADAWKGPVQHDRSAPGQQAYNVPRPITPINVNEIDFDDLLGDIMPTPAPHPLAPQAQPPSHGVPHTTPPPLAAGLSDSLDDLLGDFPPTPGPGNPGTANPRAANPGMTPVAAQPAAPQPVAAQPPRRAETPPPDALSPFAAEPPQPARAVPMSAPAVSASPVPAGPAAGGMTAGDAAALLAAFAEGAGMPQLDLSAQDPQAAMRAIGVLFAAFVGGTREVLMSRAEIKHEMRVEQTMMRARDNNALKFSVSAQEALTALLQPGRPGYKPPLDAVEEAFNDIRSHEMAVMAGLQTALIGLLKRFDPDALENRLQRGMLDGILPGARKARFWELFCATYKDIASEAQDDFHSIFGREFARAYDAQIRKL